MMPLTLLMCCFVAGANPIRPPSKRECTAFAEAGSCVASSKFMREYCWSTCDEQFRRQRLERFERPIAESFYDLVADDIKGNEVDFAEFEGKVTVVVNVASAYGMFVCRVIGITSVFVALLQQTHRYLHFYSLYR